MSAGLNLLWLVFGGIVMGIGWLIAGCLLAISIVGIPWARAAFVMANFALWPFGREAIRRDDYKQAKDIGTGFLGLLGNIVWFVFAGFWLALSHALHAVGCALTIVGIPFAIQHLKLAGHSLAPIGTVIVTKEVAKLVHRQKAEATLARARGYVAPVAPSATTLAPPPPEPNRAATPAIALPPPAARHRPAPLEPAPISPRAEAAPPPEIVEAVSAQLKRPDQEPGPRITIAPHREREAPPPDNPSAVVAVARHRPAAGQRMGWAFSAGTAAILLAAGGFVVFDRGQRGDEAAAAVQRLAAARRELDATRTELIRAREQLARSEQARYRAEQSLAGLAPGSGVRPPAAAEAPRGGTGTIRDCDRLAAHPHDPDKANGVDGVEFKDLEKQRAEEVCRDAVAATHGAVPRLVYQHARVLHAQRRFAEAFEEYRKAADLGYAAAEASVGYMYLAGQGVASDTATALPYLRRAATKGHPEAQFSLLHALGSERGSEAERATAYFWGLLAARTYRVQSQEKLAALARILPDERRAEIERLARTWRPGDASP